jgi:hypothetical protein
MEQNKTNNQEPQGDVAELEASQEKQLKRSNRIVVFGQRSDARSVKETGDVIDPNQEQMDIHGVRRVDLIEDGFYDRFQEGPVVYEKPAKEPTRGQRLANFLLRRDTETEAPLVETPSEPREDTIPMGVVIFPSMRYHDGARGASMDVDTPYEEIEKLCVENGVKFVKVSDEEGAPSLEQILADFK